MTPLRQRMSADLQLRGLAERTQDLRLIQAYRGHPSPATTSRDPPLTLTGHARAAAPLNRLREERSWARSLRAFAATARRPEPRSGPRCRPAIAVRGRPSHHGRTAALGGPLSSGEPCHAYPERYQSCKNRPCPTCPHGSAQAWRHRQPALRRPRPACLGPVPVPEALRPWARRHPTLFSNRRGRSAAPALQDLAWAPRFVGGPIGLVGVWHPGTRALHDHPPGHDRRPAGGLAADGRQWLPAREHCRVPVQRFPSAFVPTCARRCTRPPCVTLSPPRSGKRTGACRVSRLARALTPSSPGPLTSCVWRSATTASSDSKMAGAPSPPTTPRAGLSRSAPSLPQNASAGSARTSCLTPVSRSGMTACVALAPAPSALLTFHITRPP